MTVTEAANKLGVSPQRVRFLIAAGRLTAWKIGGVLWWIKPEDLNKITPGKNGRPAAVPTATPKPLARTKR